MMTEIEIQIKDKSFFVLAESLNDIMHAQITFKTPYLKAVYSVLSLLNIKFQKKCLDKLNKPSKKGEFKLKMKVFEAYFLEILLRNDGFPLCKGYEQNTIQQIINKLNQKLA